MAALALWGGRGGQVISSTPDVGQMEEPLSAHQRTYTLIYFFNFDLIQQHVLIIQSMMLSSS